MAARPRSITDAQILDAARTVFTRDGASASTLAVARHAGVSEGTIYKRFPTKDILFRRAMGCGDEVFAIPEHIDAEPVDQQLVAICIQLIAHLQQVVPRMLTLAAHGSFDPKAFWRDHPEASPLAPLRRLTDYVDALARAGRVRVTDPEIVARTVLAAMHNYAFLDHVGLHARMPLAAQTFARGFVDILWRGLDPDAPPSS